MMGTVAAHQPGPDPSAEWWTTTDAAAYLGLQVATVSSYRSRGQMPQPDLTLGRTHVWRPSIIIAWHSGRPRPGVGGRPTGHENTGAENGDEQRRKGPLAHGFANDQRWTLGRIKTLIGKLFHVGQGNDTRPHSCFMLS
jgi:hypothetical protein